MKQFFKPKTWLITLMMYLVAVSLAILMVEWQNGGMMKFAQAGAEHNVTGYAWSENFGWVSFNCTNEASCGSVNYGVSVNSGTGDFSGYAWSANLGWIDFAPTVGYPEAPNTGAHYDSVTGAVTGWAKILTLGNDGWLKMSGTWANGVNIDNASGDFFGWAWNGNAVSGLGVGWLSFNCLNDGSCGASNNYKVSGTINQAPMAENLTSPNWSNEQACGSLGALISFLRWQFNDADAGDTESAYQIIVDDDADPAGPLADTGKCTAYHVPNTDCLIDAGVDNFPLHNLLSLNYGQTYYWWVKVWDNHNTASNFASTNFTSYLHEFPNVDFSWSPAMPSQGEEVQFSDASTCAGGCLSYYWTIPPDATIDDPNIADPVITFGSSGEMNVTLEVTDGSGYNCSQTKILDLKQSLPSWKEVKPE